jgi:hypothetical protein
MLKQKTVRIIANKTKMSKKEIEKSPLCVVYKKSKHKLNCREINSVVLDFLES